MHSAVAEARLRPVSPDVRPRIAHLIPEIFGPDGIIGGAERYAYELARHMAVVAPTRLITFGPRNSRFVTDGIEVRVIGNPTFIRGQRNNPFSPKLFSELRWADVVHCHQPHVLVSSLAAIYCRLTGRRVFATDLGGGGWDVSAYLSTDSWFHGHLHISEYSRRIAGHQHRQSARVIFGGVDTEKFSPDKTVKRKGIVLFVGRILSHKGINDLIEALPQELELEIVGQVYDTRFYDDLRKMAAGKRVTFRHDCDEDELVQAYRRALCIVLPSVYHTMYGLETAVPELLGQTLLEGMACGTPAICTDVASMPEVVSDGVTGFIVPPNNPEALREKIGRLNDHPHQAARMGSAARECVLQRFSWSKVVRICCESYGVHPEIHPR